MPSDAMRVWREAAWAAREEGEGDEDKRALLAAAVIERAIADAVAEREALIVQWLRKQDEPNERWLLQNSHYYADAIERGDYKERQDG